MYGESRMKKVVYNVKSEYTKKGGLLEERKREKESREIYTKNLAEEEFFGDLIRSSFCCTRTMSFSTHWN